MTAHLEQTLETTMEMHMWYPHQTPASTSTLSLSKTPLLREVPQMKRKLTTRLERDSTTGTINDNNRHFQNLKSAAPSWLREKPSRQKLNGLQKSSPHFQGAWKRVTVTCRDNSVLLLYGEDRSMLHSISLKDLSANDIRLIDDSLFSIPNVLGIFSRQSTLQLGSKSPLYNTSDRSISTPLSTRRQPIYLCFPTAQKMKKWRGLLRTFARAELYGPANKGGTHRCHRQIDMKILEAKVADDRRLVASPSIGALRGVGGGAALEDVDHIEAPSSTLGLSNPSGALPKPYTEETIYRVTSKSALQAAPLLISTSNIISPSKEVESESSDGDSDNRFKSGPISGLSGRSRIFESNSMSPTVIAYEVDKKVSDGPSVVAPTCYCLIWIAGELIAQTKMCTSSFKSMTWFEKMSFKDLPSLSSIQIDVMQSGRYGKSGILGTVHLPVETMRRGEPIEGWFPIWATRARDSEVISSPGVESFYTEEVVGEIKIAINVAEETILPMKNYTAIEEALVSNHHLGLISLLCKHLDEDQIISHLVDIYASRGSIVEHLKELIEAESVKFGDNPALLFRSNTLLTRAIDKYQRFYCRDWLDSCIGLIVRRVCQDQIYLEASDSQYNYVNPILVQESPSSTITAISAESNLDALLRLCKELWFNIYSNRQRCPSDLRSVLFYIRTKVNTHFPRSDTQSGPGIQGVGAFVFLRLICPAITTPHLYGLMGSSPSAASSKTLMLIAKVFLALANKRIAFDKDKEPWLGQADDFLTVQAPAYDDFITFVSSEPPRRDTVKEIAWGDEADYEFQRSVKALSKELPTLHRESLPSQDYMLDRPLVLAELVSFVVREASVDLSGGGQQQQQHRNGDGQVQDRYQDFVDLCCDIEDKAGMYLDRAGFNPEPIDFSKIDNSLSIPKTTQVYTGVKTPSKVITSISLSHLDSLTSSRTRRATVSGIRLQNVDAANTSHTSSTSSSGKDSRSSQQQTQNEHLSRLPMIFAAHLKSVPLGRSSLDSSDERKRATNGRSAPKGAEEVGVEVGGMRKMSLGGGSQGYHLDHYQENQVNKTARPSSLRKVKQSWWKRL